MGMPIHLNPGINIYLQNNGKHFGNHLSSIVLSCNFSREEGEDRIGKLVKHVGKKSRTEPLSWSAVMDRRSLFSESYDDEQAGDLLRDECEVARAVDVDGGFLFGGFEGTKHSRSPKITVNEEKNSKERWSRPAIVVLCKHENQHKCTVEIHKDTGDNLYRVQDIISKTFLREELKEWNANPSAKAKPIVAKISDLLASVGTAARE